jgi:FkbM family methyltransferase
MADKTRVLEINLPSGGWLPFTIYDTPSSMSRAEEVLNGRSYPHLFFVKDVRTVVDIGANVGLTSAWFSILYPGSRIIAVEPAPETFALLAENAKRWTAIEPCNVGLHRTTRTADLFPGADDGGTSSLHRYERTKDTPVTVQLENAEAFLQSKNVGAIDVLKVDTEGCERPILEAIQSRLPAIRIIYLEYHSERDRNWINDLLTPTHLLERGRVLRAHLGELCYVARDAHPYARDLEIGM